MLVEHSGTGLHRIHTCTNTRMNTHTLVCICIFAYPRILTHTYTRLSSVDFGVRAAAAVPASCENRQSSSKGGGLEELGGSCQACWRIKMKGRMRGPCKGGHVLFCVMAIGTSCSCIHARRHARMQTHVNARIQL
jgi:cytochrome c oxidase assembly factor CtaG